jgi:hypothetical protein
MAASVRPRDSAGVSRSALVLALAVALALAAGGPAAARTLSLDGPGATRVGHQVTFFGRVTPAVRGVGVGIYLGSSLVERTATNDDGSFVARPHISSPGAYRARAPGAISTPCRVRIVRPLLRRDSHGAAVHRLVARLADLGYAVRTRATTEFTGAVRQSVYAFQKAQGIAVDGIVGPVTRSSLTEPSRVEPRFDAPSLHIEVDKTRQLLLRVRNGRVTTIVNTSTAGIPGYRTPEGAFRIFRRVEGIDMSPLGRLYDPLYFVGGYAIHGSTNVPPRAASHGCVRVAIWEAARLFDVVPHGEVVYVY